MCEEDKMSTDPAANETQSVIRKARNYFRLFCDITGKVFDMIDGPAMELQNRVQGLRDRVTSNISDIRQRIQQPTPNPSTLMRAGGGKKKRRTQKKRK